MSRNLFLGIGFVGVLLYLTREKANTLIGNLSPGSPKIKSFKVLSGSSIFPINNFSDFKRTTIDIVKGFFQGLNPLQIINFDFSSIQIPPVKFRFDLDFPLTNNNDFSLPNNTWNGTLHIDGDFVGNVSYPPTDIPANETAILKTNITTSISNSAKLLKRLLTNPSKISKGGDFKGTLTSNGVNVPFSFNSKFF